MHAVGAVAIDHLRGAFNGQRVALPGVVARLGRSGLPAACRGTAEWQKRGRSADAAAAANNNNNDDDVAAAFA